MTRDRATYVYCLVKDAKAPNAESAPKGPPGVKGPRLLELGKGAWMVVGDAPLSRYGEAALEEGLRDLDWVSRCALSHQAVVEHFRSSKAVVPMKLFTLYLDDRRALEFVARDRRRLDEVLARVAGREEYGVRVALDEARALRLAERRAHSAAGSPKSGSGYLMRKKKVQDTFRDFSAQARAAAEEVHQRLSSKAPQAGGKLLLDAAYLVPKRRAPSFLKAAQGLAGILEDEGYALTLTGPWPPYNFISGAA